MKRSLGGVAARWAALWIALPQVGCSPRRHIDLEFTDQGQAGAIMVSDIQRVDIEVFDGDDCRCADLDQKPGCTMADEISSITFSPTSGERTGGGFPDGKLTVRVAAYGPANAPIGLRATCWCVPDLADQTLAFPLGSPTMAAGQGCQ